MKKTRSVLKVSLLGVMLISVILVALQPGLFASDLDHSAVSSTAIAEVRMNGRDRAISFFAAMAAVSFACLASAYALGRIGSAAMGAMSEKPELGGRAIIFLGMAEGIAIYGLIVAIMILNKL